MSFIEFLKVVSETNQDLYLLLVIALFVVMFTCLIILVWCYIQDALRKRESMYNRKCAACGRASMGSFCSVCRQFVL